MTTPQIEFTDDDGVRWTVARHPAAHLGLVRLEFVSDAGERRACEVVGLEEKSWKEGNELAWRSVVQHAEVIEAATGGRRRLRG